MDNQNEAQAGAQAEPTDADKAREYHQELYRRLSRAVSSGDLGRLHAITESIPLDSAGLFGTATVAPVEVEEASAA